MADNDVATRAPESDAQEAPPQHVPPPAAPGQSVIPGDSIAQQGPTMGVGNNLTSTTIRLLTDHRRNIARQTDPVPMASHPQAN